MDSLANDAVQPLDLYMTLESLPVCIWCTPSIPSIFSVYIIEEENQYGLFDSCSP